VSPERWQQIQNLFDQVRELPSNERAAVFQETCAGDEELRREVEWMLTHQSEADCLIQVPALEVAAISLAAHASASLTESTLGPYRDLELIGAGGMGEVYSARDTRLDRRVAIKRLRRAFVNDSERIARLEREAKLLATLNHPNIAAIYELDECDGLKYLVMELVPGVTLAERLSPGPMKSEDALRVGGQIAQALEAAHEKGIIHRDLKPTNIKITPEDNVKVLDFGLAKALSDRAAGINLSQSEPTTKGETREGLILGTPAYMSPEQAQGKALDKRTDVWSFGCVVYEMLCGRRAFAGETVTDTITAILEDEPDWTLLPPETPEVVTLLLRKCLNKDPGRRLHDIADWQVFADEAARSPTPQQPARSLALSPRRGWFTALTLVALLLAAGLVITYVLRPPVHERELRLEISTPATSAPFEFALSPDGRYIIFVASGDGPQRLWLRTLNETEARPMPGTEGANYPFWSADSRSIGFTAAGKLKRIDIAGGSPQILANSSVTRSGAWNADGTILFTASFGPLSRIAASGGEPVVVTRLDAPRQTQHRHPRFLPDGRHFLFYVDGTPEASGIYLGSLDGGEPKRLTAADAAGASLGPGTIAFVRQASLIGQHLDVKRGELTGDPVKLVDAIGSTAFGFGGFSLSADGTLAYRGGGAQLRQLRWYDRTGKVVGVAGDPVSTLLHPELSPDGGRVALQRTVQGNVEVWLMDLFRGGMTRFTFDPGRGVPIWSPNGEKIAFAGANNLYLKPSNSSSVEGLLLEQPNAKYTQDWSKDGRFLLYGESSLKTGRDLWALPMTGNDRRPIAIGNTKFEELNGQFHPDGSWVAFETNESGRFEIEVQGFPEPRGKWQVSTIGGIQPRWRADGKELYFIAPDGKLMAASITTSGETFAAGTPVALFSTGVAPGAGINKQQYMVSRDGRFLINQPAETSTATPITLILNWKPKL
jgi:eukaryotic-like serine/threonine-protein kinase